MRQLRRPGRIACALVVVTGVLLAASPANPAPTLLLTKAKKG